MAAGSQTRDGVVAGCKPATTWELTWEQRGCRVRDPERGGGGLQTRHNVGVYVGVNVGAIRV